jgi:uncharacterized membrane protein SirB2
MYWIIKSFHMAFAALAIAGFLLRGYWMIIGSNLQRNRATRIAPHIVDTLFFSSGIWLVIMLNLDWVKVPWLLAKFAGLSAYVGFGMIAMRFGRTQKIRTIAFVGAVAAFAYIAGVALTKSPASWIAF